MPATFEPYRYDREADPVIRDTHGNVWTPTFRHECSFDDEIFRTVMLNFVKNPNLNSSWLFRADILHDDEDAQIPSSAKEASVPWRPIAFEGYEQERSMVRRLIPRNPKRDDPLDQTCIFTSARDQDGRTMCLLVYIPHVSSPEEVPFYHPKVRGIAHLHEWDPATDQGSVSLHYWHFDDDVLRQSEKVERTALMILSQLHKHGQGCAGGYVKRVHHDTIINQARVQNKFTKLKHKYAPDLIASWAEVTDPAKHVFEDLAIASFLIELWADMYKDMPFPGFVDIGCGNGLLVYLLRKEGYVGWGFDARSRRSWEAYNIPLDSPPAESSTNNTDSLQVRVLLPSCVWCPEAAEREKTIIGDQIHDGMFPPGTFIISNHGDELTPWTPILAAQSNSPFIAIPCCSHSLTGSRFRAPPPADPSKGKTRYAGLVAWVSNIAEDCGFKVETEMLRIPSTRNAGLIGRTWTAPGDLAPIIAKYGGTAGYYENVSKLLKVGPSSH